MQDELLTLCLRAEQGDEAARDELYDDHGVNDEDRAALMAHVARHAAPTLTRCSICHGTTDHSLACPTRWYR